MNSTLVLGTILTISVAISLTSVYATTGYFEIVSAQSDGTTHSMTLEEKVPQIPQKKAEDLVSFWAWAIPIPADAPDGTALAVDAITIHHGVNDHQAFGMAAKSSPVQSFHPHKAYFDNNNCVIGLESPKADFRVKDNTVTLSTSDVALAAATGTIGSRSDCDTGLGITQLADLVEIP